MRASTDTHYLALPGWSWSIALRLGRVSNLPTVWSNTLAAVLLSGADASTTQVVGLMLSMSLAYIGGMFLNDAFDRKIDAIERPDRPIPSKQILARDVFIAGYALLAGAIILVALVAIQSSNVLSATLCGIALSMAIICYNVWHKGNPISPVLMGLCRLLVYITCAQAITDEPSALLYIGSFIALAYLIGLTYTAKQEKIEQIHTLWPLLFLAAPLFFGLFNASNNIAIWLSLFVFTAWTVYCLRLILRRRKGDIPRAVVSLIAGISLVDGLFILIAAGSSALPNLILLYGAALAAFLFTLIFQRYISGT